MSEQRNKFTQTPERDWKPRNKQTALVVAKSSWIHQPPEQPTKINTRDEDHKAYLENLRRTIESKEQDIQARKERRAQAKAEKQATAKPTVKKATCNWMTKLLKRQRRAAGLPPPTSEEIQSAKRSVPWYGKVMYKREQSTPLEQGRNVR